MAPTSDVLFVAICSNNKLPGGKPYDSFDATNGIVHQVEHKFVPRLLDARRKVLRLVQDNPEAHLGGIPVRDLPLAKGLSVGPEFDSGAKAAERQYLMAIQRYGGRFYLGMGRDRLERVVHSRHHVLIISGLYGLVTPTEPIQSYSCHVNHHSDIPKVWQNNDLLAHLIASYVRKHNITTVLDLTADEDYRQLVAWEVVRHAAKGYLLHAFSNMYAGADALQSFGTLLDQFIEKGDETFHELRPQDKVEVVELGTEITFLDYPNPPSSPATLRVSGRISAEKKDPQAVPKQDERVTYSDNIGRMRRNLLKATADILMLDQRDNLDYMPRIERVIEKHPSLSDCRDALRKFNIRRIAVEYKRYELRPLEMQGLLDDYEMVLRRFEKVTGSIDKDSLELLR